MLCEINLNNVQKFLWLILDIIHDYDISYICQYFNNNPHCFAQPPYIFTSIVCIVYGLDIQKFRQFRSFSFKTMPLDSRTSKK